MDIVYILRHSKFDDLEIRYSLRSIVNYFPAVGKVWVFGDCPEFLTKNKDLAEHISHEYIADTIGLRHPLTNFFQLLFAASLIPDLSDEFLFFCDDFILIDELTLESAREIRYLQDLSQVTNRGRGLWKDSLWRTYDILKRLKYPGLNFETHTPTYFRRKWIFEAYRDFKDWVTRDRWLGMLGPTAILNHAMAKHGLDPVHLDQQDTRAGFWHKASSYEQIAEGCAGKKLLNFDDDAFNDDMRRYLLERFPQPCHYEQISETGASKETLHELACFQTVASFLDPRKDT